MRNETKDFANTDQHLGFNTLLVKFRLSLY